MNTHRNQLKQYSATIGILAWVTVHPITRAQNAQSGDGDGDATATTVMNLPVAVVPSGGTSFNDGSIGIVGEVFVGTISSSRFVMHVGALPVLRAAVPEPETVRLVGSSPACGQSVWRTANNFVLLSFDDPITAPAAGQIEVNELRAGGAFGADLSASFGLSVEGGSTLRVQESGTSLSNQTWYTIRNTGGWPGVEPFMVDFVVLIGDANNDGRVLAADASVINAGIPCANCPDDRRDINGDGRVLAGDASLTYARIPSLARAKPSGHTCSP